MHNTNIYLLEPTHKITVVLIGIGGTGSRLLPLLGQLHATLTKLGHPGLYVRVFDNDTVEAPNIGRQLFSESDFGEYNAKVAVERVNRFFGTEWDFELEKYSRKNHLLGNIMISCVDSLSARREIKYCLDTFHPQRQEQGMDNLWERPFYWLDSGNGRKYGQVVLGTSKQNCVEKKDMLPDVFDMFPQWLIQEDDGDEPSCSLEEAIGKQDLFICNTMATYASQLIWQLLKQGKIDYHGAFINLETLTTSPIKIKKYELEYANPTRRSNPKRDWSM
jgi:PRTRC genetic system ThiF family protein